MPLLTEIEKNNCFSTYTQSDLNEIRKKTILKGLFWLTVQFMSEKCACAIIGSSQNFQIWPVNNSFSLFVSPKKKASKKEKKKFKNCYLNWENLDLYLLLSFHKRFFVSFLASSNNGGCDRGGRCFSVSFSALFTY